VSLDLAVPVPEGDRRARFGCLGGELHDPAYPVFGFLRRLLDLHLEFVDDVERELAP
jgi:hypothetical protein